MDSVSELWRRLRYLLSRSRFDEDLQEEMRLHLELRTAEQSAAGMPPEDAASAAKKRFGNRTRVLESSREAWGWTFWETLAKDIRHGIRTLAADRGFAVAAVLSLVLGIGANTAVFSILNAVMLRTLPVQEPGALAVVKFGDNGFLTNPLWEEIRDRQSAFSGVLTYSPDDFDLAEGGEVQLTHGVWVNGDYFHTLGVPAIRGRTFTPEDDLHGGGRSGPVAVVSYAFWQDHFAGDPGIVGKTVKLNRHPFEIIGVTPPWFKGLDVDQPFDVAIPVGCEPIMHTDRSALSERSWWWLRVIGRLRPGETLAQAEAQMKSIAPAITRATLPPHWDAQGKDRYLHRSFSLAPAATGFSNTGNQYRTGLFTLMAAVALVLLIACANIANLLLARASARQHEVSIRLAIGASRVRVIRQLLTESLLLSVAGAAGGALFAMWGSRLLLRLLSTSRNALQVDVSPDWRVLAFTSAIAILTALLFGVAPALRVTAGAPNRILKENARGAVAGASRFHLGRALVSVQVALSLVLLTGAVLFLGSLRNLLTVDAGFDRHNVLLVSARIPPERVPKTQRRQMFDDMLARLRGIPGVNAAAASSLTPISNLFWNEETHPEGYQPKPAEDDALVYFNRVSPGYFEALRTRVLAGRDFADRDTLSAPRVMIIGETTARHFWGGANPIGKLIRLDHEGTPGQLDSYEVIGLVADVKYGELKEKTLMTAYLPFTQDPDPSERTTFEIRAGASSAGLTSEVRAIAAAVNKDMSLEFKMFEQQVGDSLLQSRLLALLTAFFSALALLLAVTGLYGVVSYLTARRRNEIGIRIALGARYGSVIRLVLRDVATMIGIGIVAGVAGCIAGSRVVKALCYGVSATDPSVLVLVVSVLGISTAIAGYLPARRAARMDPMAALRDE
jgi:predicted permease